MKCGSVEAENIFFTINFSLILDLEKSNDPEKEMLKVENGFLDQAKEENPWKLLCKLKVLSHFAIHIMLPSSNNFPRL